MTGRWRQVSLDCDPRQVDTVSELLSSYGAQAITLSDASDQPLFESDLGDLRSWDATRVTGLFSPDAEVEHLGARLDEISAGGAGGRCRVESVSDRQWERAWMDRITPLRFGRRLWVLAEHHPSHAPDAIEIRLDPGLAFGTGHHPTTALCMEWLESQPVGPDDVVVDYGCGSGILAIAAAKLGAGVVIAVDSDAHALAATRSNAERNGVAAALRVCTPEALYDSPQQRPTASVVIANILADPLVALAPELATISMGGGRLALCGILARQCSAVEEAYREWFTLKAPARRDEWVRIEAIRATSQ